MADPSAPLIVITVTDPAQTNDPALTLRKQELYAEAIARHGGRAVAFHVNTPPAERERLLAEMDGLLLSGGAGDIDPALYGETPNGAHDIDQARDAMEHHRLEDGRAAGDPGPGHLPRLPDHQRLLRRRPASRTCPATPARPTVRAPP